MRKGVFPAVALFLVFSLSPRFLSWTLSRLFPPIGTPAPNSRLSPPGGSPQPDGRLFPPTGAPTPQPQSRLSPPIGAPTPPTTTSTP